MSKPVLKDTDYLAATTRVRALERSLLSKERMDRMLDARSDEDAVKVLFECGYPEFSAGSDNALESALSEEREKTYKLLYSIVENRGIVDVFRIKYDYHNAKAWMKCEALGENCEHLLIDAGRMSVKSMTEVLRQNETRWLPPALRSAYEEAKDVLARTSDPQLSDLVLDRACFNEMTATAKTTGSAFLEGYLRLQIDAANLRSAVRAMRTGRGQDFMRNLMISGGDTDASRLVAAASSGGALEEIFSSSPLEKAAALGQAASRGERGLTHFEKACDDALVRYVKSARYISFGEQPVIAYLVSKEQEITAVRTIMSGRMALVPADAIRERLREAYV